MKNKLSSSLLVVLVMALVIQLFPMQAFAGQTTGETSDKTGYIPVEGIEVELSAEEMEEAYTLEEQEKGNSVYADESWAVYESRYYYNLMTPAKKALYDALYNQCMWLLTNNNADAAYTGSYITTNLVEYTGMSYDDMLEVVYLFTLSNPQFFFIQGTAAVYGTQGGRDYAALIVYSEWQKGIWRMADANTFRAMVESWLDTIRVQPDDYSKAKDAHDTVCEMISYDYSGDWEPHQSSATAVLDRITVCAGYAQVYALLCNAAGVPAICVTSYDHEWNQVYVNGAWRIVDCTWDDSGESGTIWYDYFLKTDAEVNDIHHQPEAYLAAYRPACLEDGLNSAGIYLWQYENGKIEGGAVTNDNCDKTKLEYRWLVYDVANNMWDLASDWSYDYGIHYYPKASGDYLVKCDVRDDKGTEVSATVGVIYRHVIKETCQIPYEGNQYLIGVQSFDNPNNEYSYEMLILDVNLFTQGLPAWTYTTGALKTQGDTMWTTWAPVPGDYWTLFRVYDKNGNMLDQVCYGFSHR